METSLHRELKRWYAGPDAPVEVRLGQYRIDALDGERLVEIQHGPLSLLRRKVQALVVDHDVAIVKPLVARKRLLVRSRRGGRIVRERWSPRRGTLLDVFHELVRFMGVFPHPRLELVAVLVDVEELRRPKPLRERRWRRSRHVMEDQRLLAVNAAERLRTGADLRRLLPVELPPTWDTRDLAAGLGVDRWVAQQIAYCLLRTGASEDAGRRRTGRLYRFGTETGQAA